MLSLGVAVFDNSNFLGIGLAFFVLLIGIMLVMMGFLGGQEAEKKQAQTPGIFSLYPGNTETLRQSEHRDKYSLHQLRR